MGTYPVPANVNDAMSRKRALNEAITQLQTRLGSKVIRDDHGRHLIDPRERSAFKDTLKAELAEKLNEVGYLKDWLRLNATGKPSEWELLGRAYRILNTLDEKGLPIGDDGEALLGDIEMHVPHAFLVARAAT